MNRFFTKEKIKVQLLGQLKNFVPMSLFFSFSFLVSSLFSWLFSGERNSFLSLSLLRKRRDENKLWIFFFFNNYLNLIIWIFFYLYLYFNILGNRWKQIVNGQNIQFVQFLLSFIFFENFLLVFFSSSSFFFFFFFFSFFSFLKTHEKISLSPTKTKQKWFESKQKKQKQKKNKKTKKQKNKKTKKKTKKTKKQKNNRKWLSKTIRRNTESTRTNFCVNDRSPFA